jgi:hypothetical protein
MIIPTEIPEEPLFYAHTTLDGVRLKLIPPNVPNPDKPIQRDRWDFNIGVRTFHSNAYKIHVRSAYTLIPALMKRLEEDIAPAIPTVAQQYAQTSAPFELNTGAEHFDLKQCMAELKKRDRSRQQSPPEGITVFLTRGGFGIR